MNQVQVVVGGRHSSAAPYTLRKKVFAAHAASLSSFHLRWASHGERVGAQEGGSPTLHRGGGVEMRP